jgi:hypothetical protein
VLKIMAAAALVAGSMAGVLAASPVGAAATHNRPAPEHGRLVLLGGLRAVPVSTAASSPVELVNGAHGLCLDANKTGDHNNGDVVQLWSCSGASNQMWKENNGEFINQGGQLCLDADASGTSTNGDKVQLWSCSGALNQRWVSITTYQLQNLAGARLCLDAAASGDGNNGDKVQLWSCGPSDKSNQEWCQYFGIPCHFIFGTAADNAQPAGLRMG